MIFRNGEHAIRVLLPRYWAELKAKEERERLRNPWLTDRNTNG